MARKARNLASFDELATNINNNINKNLFGNDNTNNDENIDNIDNHNINKIDSTNDNNNVDVNINTNKDIEITELDYLDKLIEGKTKKSESYTVLTGVYLQKDLAKILDSLAKKGGRGAKSRIVNEALRSVFKEKGLL